MKCAICVIIYKDTLYKFEQLSLLRIIDFCIKTNRLDDLTFIIPKLIADNFDEFCEKYINKFIIDNYNFSHNFTYISYPNICFNSVNAYNNMLMLSKNFYGDFINNYDYMLLYQLDGYIFDDHLNYFLEKEYDFIGGYYIPIYADILEYCEFDNLDNHKILMNGGVSLKNLKFCIDIINKYYDEFINGCEFNDVFKYINEDTFFSKFCTTNISAIESMNFSLNWLGAENNWCIIDYKYPFCCHGIDKNKFLMKLIENYNKEHNLNYDKYIN